MRDDTATVLGTAARLVEQYGHNVHAWRGSPLTGYSVPGAIEQAAQYVSVMRPNGGSHGQEAALPYMGAQLGQWVLTRGALDCVAEILGYQSSRLDVGQVRDLVTIAADGAGPVPLGTAWAVAVLDQAQQVAAMTILAMPAAPTSPALPVPVVPAR